MAQDHNILQSKGLSSERGLLDYKGEAILSFWNILPSEICLVPSLRCFWAAGKILHPFPGFWWNTMILFAVSCAAKVSVAVPGHCLGIFMNCVCLYLCVLFKMLYVNGIPFVRWQGGSITSDYQVPIIIITDFILNQVDFRDV